MTWEITAARSNSDDLRAKLAEDWEPYAVTPFQIGGRVLDDVVVVHLRREIVELVTIDFKEGQ